MTWYIVDGMDGSGKSSAAKALKDMLESDGRRVFIVTHPDQGCWFGRAEARFLKVPGKPSEIIATMLYILDAVQSVMRMRTSRGRYDDFIFVRYIMAVAYLPDGIYRKAYGIIERILPMPDVRIMVDVDADTFADNNILLYYVGTSRARLWLDIITTMDSEACTDVLQDVFEKKGHIRSPQKELAAAINAVPTR